ncbi:protein COFACTOR ASSEMBLY OF COMPLEX C SUBUNIT B CCB1, chloroplastic isoform X2 [Durio zibethinus]|uniref:Protein COFACTOR ASSEMBLY OF COMPLEX C SUBUNIT B CCB1, chloroplastic isoform X2 n=1 Tax=Durio zibethinus TaxID=66656 RepID=A0A6P5YID5_DURZI|nr:protein COFACTOR ASSEMBLY OF COMPLEX C SUBUNIT B CCB1, chloroplastic isoform X2 [Durio zibethinus]
MATKIISPHPQALSSFFPSKCSGRLHQHRPWLGRDSTHVRPQRQLLPRLSLQQTIIASSALADLLQPHQQNPDSIFLLAGSAGYSLASYYTSLGLFVISVPGLWSLIKRSVKSKIVQKTFIGEEAEKKAPNQVAGEILSFFTRNNFVVTDRGETITGAYYWKRASRKEQIKVKMLVGEDGTLSEIVVRGDDQQIDQMRKELKLSEKGMVYVKGIFER